MSLMRGRIAWMALTGLLWTGSVAAESWRDASQRLYEQGQSLLATTDSNWAGSMIAEDMRALLGALDTLRTLERDPDLPLDARVLTEVRHRLGRYRQNLRISLATRPELEAGPWLSQVEGLERRLAQLEQSFGGRRLPSAGELAQSSYSRDWSLPNYTGPEELLREARSIRVDLQTGRNPWVNPGAGGFGIGGWGLGVGNGGFFGNEYQELLLAADRFERVCQSDYVDVRQTQTAYRKLDQAFQRLWPAARSQSFGLRNVERSLARLEQFYQALEPEPGPHF